MKVRNDSDAAISDEEIKEIVTSNVRINLLNRTTKIRVSSDCYVILEVVATEPEFVTVGKLNKAMRWGLDDEGLDDEGLDGE